MRGWHKYSHLVVQGSWQKLTSYSETRIGLNIQPWWFGLQVLVEGVSWTRLGQWMVLCEFITWLVEAWVLLSFLTCWLQTFLGSLLPWGPPHGKRCHLLVLLLATQFKAWHTMGGGAKRVWTPEGGSLWAFSERGTPGRIHPFVSKGKWLWKELSRIMVPSLGDLFTIRGCFLSCTFFPMAWICIPLSRFICWNLIPNVVV